MPHNDSEYSGDSHIITSTAKAGLTKIDDFVDVNPRGITFGDDSEEELDMNTPVAPNPSDGEYIPSR